MAVYKRSYERYQGGLTPEWSRFLVIPRYAFEELARYKTLALLLLASAFWPLLCALFIYLSHNLSALAMFKIPAGNLAAIDNRFFLTFLGVQSIWSFFVAAFIGPGLVAPDLMNNGLSLYLARPFSRAEYVLGKLTTLTALLSAITWVPGLLLFVLQSYLEGAGWGLANARIAAGVFFGSWAWILLLSLLALALSAWVRWKPVAGALLFGVFFVAGAFGAAVNAVLKTNWGHLINIGHLIGALWSWLFAEAARRGGGGPFFRVQAGEEIPIWSCVASLLGICLICLYLLWRKVRGVEVVK